MKKKKEEKQLKHTHTGEPSLLKVSNLLHITHSVEVELPDGTREVRKLNTTQAFIDALNKLTNELLYHGINSALGDGRSTILSGDIPTYTEFVRDEVETVSGNKT